MTAIFVFMINYWMQKSRQNFPNSTITTSYRGPTSFKSESSTMQIVLTISPCKAMRQSSTYLILSKVKLTVSFTSLKGYISKNKFYLLFWMMSRNPHMVSFNPTTQTVKMWHLQFVVKKTRLVHSKLKLKRVTGCTKNDR